MAFFGSLGKLLNRGINTVNNDVVKPVQRYIAPVANAVHTLLQSPPQQGFTPAPMQQVKPNFTAAPMQKINLAEGGNLRAGQPSFGAPTIPAYQGNQARLNAQKQLGLTPAFVQNLINANPYVGKPLATNALGDTQGAGAEYLGQRSLNQIVLSPNQTDPATVLHEGLHRIYDNNPQLNQQFTKAYNQSATPFDKNYLLSRLYAYKGAAKGLDQGGVPIPNYNPNDLNTLQPNLQNEAHSFTSEIPAIGLRLPSALNNYYKQYFNPVNSPAINRLRQRKVGTDIRGGA